jgi:hypothetical protein
MGGQHDVVCLVRPAHPAVDVEGVIRSRALTGGYLHRQPDRVQLRPARVELVRQGLGHSGLAGSRRASNHSIRGTPMADDDRDVQLGSFAITRVWRPEFSPGIGLFAITSTQTRTQLIGERVAHADDRSRTVAEAGD